MVGLLFPLPAFQQSTKVRSAPRMDVMAIYPLSLLGQTNFTNYISAILRNLFLKCTGFAKHPLGCMLWVELRVKFSG